MISTCSRSPFLFPDIPLTIYIPLARTTNVHSPIIPNHVYGGTHENNTGKSGNPYLTSVVARGYRFPFAGNFPSPSGNNLLHPNRTRNISVPNPPLSTLLVAGAGLRQRGLAVRSVGNSQHVLSPGDSDCWLVFKNGIPPIPDGPVLLRPLSDWLLSSAHDGSVSQRA